MATVKSNVDKRRSAHELTKRARGQIIVKYDPGAIDGWESDLPDEMVESRGHLYSIEPGDTDEYPEGIGAEMYVDDRGGDDLAVLVAAELRRVASLYNTIADAVEGGAE